MSEFFLRRYRKIDPEVTIIDREELRQALRMNTDRIAQAKLATRLRKRGVDLEKIPFLERGYYCSAEFSLGATQEYLLGYYYLQGPLSQLACEVLDPKGDVLDMAAAPGGKTTYLAQLTDGFVLALDSHPMRLKSVQNNVERLGITNVACAKRDARFAFEFGKAFDSILLDAPCSGNYCSENGWFEKRMIEDIKSNSRVQKELLRAAHTVLKPGGKLLYSTCSLEPEENELVIDWAIKKFDDWELVPIDVPLGDEGVVEWEKQKLDPSLAKTKRFWPHKTGCEGFFMALLKKK